MNPAKTHWHQCIWTGFSLMAAVTAGCQSHPANLPVYSASEANQLRTSQTGTVDSVRAVIIQGDTGVTTNVGQNVGGSLGRAVATGQNPAIAVAGAAGSVVGQIAGGAVQKNVASTVGQEITVALDDGTTVVIVQKNDPAYKGGERIKLVGSGSRVTVMPLDMASVR